MAGKGSGFAKPGSSVTRKVKRGPGKGDTVKFVANSASSQEPGKLKPRVVVTDRGAKGTQSTLPTLASLKKQGKRVAGVGAKRKVRRKKA